MKRTIERPPVATEGLHALLDETEAELRQRLEQIESPYHLHEVATLAERVVAVGSVVGLDAERMRACARLTGQALAGQLVLEATSPGYEMEFAVGGERVKLRANAPVATETVASWLSAYNAALVARDRETLHVLSSIHVGALREAADGDPPNAPPEFYYSLREALLGLGPKGLQSIEPPGVPSAAQVGDDAEARVTASLFALVRAIAARDEARLRDALEASMEVHRELWANADADDAEQGWVAWGPLALVCLARSAGLACEVSNGYLPEHLLSEPPEPPTPTIAIPFETYTSSSAYGDEACCIFCLWPMAGSGECKQCGERAGELDMPRMSYLAHPRKVCGSCGARVPELAMKCAACRAAV